MVGKSFTLVDRLEELINILLFIEPFSELAIVDQDEKVILLKSQGVLSHKDIVDIFKRAKEEYMAFRVPFSFDDFGEGVLVSFYFKSRGSELVLVGLSKDKEIKLGHLSVFKLVALVIKDVFDMVELIAAANDKVGELEALLLFYKSITTPINKELFLAYILDNIMSEISVEVGSIMILGKDLIPISAFYLGLSEEVSASVLDNLKHNNRLDNVVVLELEDTDETLFRGFKGLKNIMSYPIRFENEIVGVVFLANKRVGINYVSFSNHDMEKLKVLLDPVGIIIKNYVMFRELFLLNQFNQKILSNITSIIAMTDNKCNVKYTNKKDAESLVKNLIALCEKEDLKILSDRGVEVQVNGNFYEVKVQPIVDESGEVVEMLWTIEDITYRKELINRYVLSEKMNIMSEIVSGIAHEIRNPVASISGFIELLKLKKDDQNFINKFVEVTSKDVERIINLLNSFIRFAKPAEYEISEVSLNSVVSEALDVLMYQINQKCIKVINSIPDGVTVRSNYSLLLQVFTNVLLNSIQAIEGDNGEIDIEYSEFSDNTKNYVVISVRDNGIGIPKEILGRIFDPFFTTKPDGTGLGLSICQKIIMEHGGFIKVRSEEGKGTTVLIFLPTR